MDFARLRGFCRSKTITPCLASIGKRKRRAGIPKSNCVLRVPVRTSAVPKLGVWEQELKKSADPERAKTYGQQLASHVPDYFKELGSEQARVLAAVFSGSRSLSELLIARPEWLDLLALDGLQNPRRKEGL